MKLVKDHHDLGAGVRVEISRRFVGQEKFGVIDDGTGDGNTLAFTTGEFSGNVMSATGQSDHLQSFEGEISGANTFGVEHGDFDVFDGAGSGQQVERLKDETDGAISDFRELTVGEFAPVHRRRNIYRR